MKVLAILPQPGWGGLHAHLAATARALGSEFEIVAGLSDIPEADAVAARFASYGVGAIRTPMARLRFSSLGANLRYFARLMPEAAALSELVEREGFDIVQTAGAHHFHGPLAARRSGIPLVWQIHSDLAPAPVRRGVVPFIRRYAAATMVNGYSVAARFPGITGGSGPLFYFGPVVDPADVSPTPSARTELRTAWGIREGAVVVGTVGVRGRQKQHELFVETARQATAAGTDAVFVIVGKPVPGSERSYAREVYDTQLARHLVDQSRLHFVDPARPIADYLAAFDVFSMTSRAEGMPIAVAEAMLMSLPVACVDVGGLGEMVAGGAGLLAPPGDAAALAARIDELARAPELRSRIGQQGRAKALADYSPAASARVHADAYRAALARADR